MRACFKAQEGKDQELWEQLANDLKQLRPDWLRSFREMQNFANTILERIEAQLTFAGLVILVLGGIGIWSVTRVFVQQKLKTIAILKCLGGDNLNVFAAYLTQAFALCLIGSLLGLLFAGILTMIIHRAFADSLPFHLKSGLTLAASLQGLGIGVLITFLFALPPLLEIRRVKPLLVMRQETSLLRRRIDWLSMVAALLIILVLFALASYLANSARIGGIFIGTMAGTALVLSLLGTALIYILRRLRRLPSFALRQGVGSLYRPWNQTKMILLAVGLGTLFVTAMRIQQVNIIRQLDADLSTSKSDMFFFNIQTDQRASVEESLTRMAGTAPQLFPVLRARLVDIKRSPKNSQAIESERLGREQWFTYRRDQIVDEPIIDGKFWEPVPSAVPEISVSDFFGRSFKLAIGDTLIFDLAGRKIEAVVTSVRGRKQTVSISAGYGRFDIIFRPGVLEDAPQMFVGMAKGPPPGERRANLQREFVERYPNVSLIDFYDQMAFVRERINNASLAVNFLAGFVFFCGVLILSGSVAMTKFHRLYESAILKTLGAEKKLIIYIIIIEYGVLGLLAGATGSAAALMLTWLISKYSMRIPWHPMPSVNLIGVAATILLVIVVGVLSSWDVMMKKPLHILRAE
jgi:putative ABC transport system permease protein